MTLRYSDFVLFHNFIQNKLNKVAVSQQTFLSRTSLWRKFKPFFSYPPQSEDSLFLLTREETNSNPWVMGIDGKWLRRQGVIMIYRDVTTKENLYWSYHPSESYQALERDLKRLTPIMSRNLPRGLITDWKGAIVWGVTSFLPPIAHQRCLAHVKRTLMTLLPLRSPIPATRELRTIAQSLTTIDSPLKKNEWLKEVKSWELRNKTLLKERTIGVGTKKKWWYTHGPVRRAIKLLHFEEHHLFTYLEYPFLPKTNNALEGTNSQMKTKLSNHRGMKTNQQVTYIFWLLTFQRVKTPRDLKQLWDRLKYKICRF